jgi:phosphatidylglycerophosphate synthase
MTITAAARATFQIVCGEPGPRFLGLPLAERNLRVARRHGGMAADAGSIEPVLVVPPGTAITPALFDLLPPPLGLWLLQSPQGGAPLEWRGSIPNGDDLPQTMTLPDGVVFDVSTRALRRHAAWQLLRRSGKPADGWLSRHVHRRVSRIFSYLFLRLGLSANVATFATFGVGVLSAWLMAQTSHATMIAAGFLFWFASIADGIDGEMARLTLSESRFGEQLDTGVDQLTYLFGLAGVMVGWTRQGIGPGGVVLAMVVAAGIPTVLLWAMRMVRRARRTTQRFVPTKPIEGAVFAAARQSRAPVLRAAAAVFVLFRREAFSLTFFLVSLFTGFRAIYPLLLITGLAIVTVTFLLHREELARELDREFV